MTNVMTSDNNSLSSKRSLLYRCYQELSAAVPSDDQIGLIDLSLNLRYGFRGPQAQSVLNTQGIEVPNRPNTMVTTASGEHVLRLSNGEFWLLHPDTNALEPLLDTGTSTGCYSLFCQDSHAWLVLSGAQMAKVMAKLCAVDLRDSAFPVGSIAQTSVARVNAIIAHHPMGECNVFSIFSDSASSSYLWGALQDAMEEYK